MLPTIFWLENELDGILSYCFIIVTSQLESKMIFSSVCIDKKSQGYFDYLVVLLESVNGLINPC